MLCVTAADERSRPARAVLERDCAPACARDVSCCQAVVLLLRGAVHAAWPVAAAATGGRGRETVRAPRRACLHSRVHRLTCCMSQLAPTPEAETAAHPLACLVAAPAHTARVCSRCACRQSDRLSGEYMSGKAMMLAAIAMHRTGMHEDAQRRGLPPFFESFDLL